MNVFIKICERNIINGAVTTVFFFWTGVNASDYWVIFSKKIILSLHKDVCGYSLMYVFHTNDSWDPIRRTNQIAVCKYASFERIFAWDSRSGHLCFIYTVSFQSRIGRMPSTAAWLRGKGQYKEKKRNSDGAILRVCRRLRQLICPQIAMIIIHCSHHLSSHWLKAYS